MIFDEAQAIMWKAYSDIVLKDTCMEIHFVSPERAIVRKREKPPSQKPPLQQGENEASDPKK